ncbi:putative 4-mercaptohistidine N1-methyltransferase [Hahella sp. SMD15-11]|uniref:4-mercaptohistidine N1-methyltransferase n=1 Tax=Thermohahella caldifontis TaxID=3142973 RepID=A0AB39UTI2_9GAMM
MSNPYETPELVAQYLEFHYGPAYLEVPNFPATVARLALKAAAGRGRALDLGCAVGRLTFELAREFGFVAGVDYSRAFVETAAQLQHGAALSWDIPTEGMLTESRHTSLDQLGLSETASRVRFLQGDAHRLPEDLGDFDLIVCANLIDRLHHPAAALAGLIPRLRPGGVLAITSPYTWLDDFTPRHHWLGGYRIQAKPITTREGLAEVLDSLEPVGTPREVPFVIRETARKFQHTLADMTIWRKPDAAG